MRGMKTVQNDGFRVRRFVERVVHKRRCSRFLYILPSRVRVVFIAKSRIQFFLQKEDDVYSLRNLPCNDEDNLSAEYIIIEDWFRGYCGSPGLGGPLVYDLLLWAGLVGRQDTRWKIIPHVQWGLSHVWMASIGVQIYYSFL